MWTRAEVKKSARGSIRKNYWKTFFTSLLMLALTGGTTFSITLSSVDQLPQLIKEVVQDEIIEAEQKDPKMIAVLITLACSMFLIYILVRLIMAFFLRNPIDIGFARYLTRTCRAENMDDPRKGQVSDMLWAFDHSYLHQVKAMFLRELRVALCGLLFIIPGIIKSYQYRFVPYLAMDYEELSSKELLALSREMTQGHKWQMVLFDLSFIPWHLLGVLTLGTLEVFYVEPYINLADAQLYLEIKEIYNGKDVE